MDKVTEINARKFKDPEQLEKANEIAKRCADGKFYKLSLLFYII